jgi:hypothetical protein
MEDLGYLHEYYSEAKVAVDALHQLSLYRFMQPFLDTQKFATWNARVKSNKWRKRILK